MAGEDVDLEFLRAPVTLGEGEAVTLHGALLAAGTEQNLVDGKRGNLCTRGLIHNPGEKTDTPKKFWNILIQQDKLVLSVELKVNTFIKYNTHNGFKKKKEFPLSLFSRLMAVERFHTRYLYFISKFTSCQQPSKVRIREAPSSDESTLHTSRLTTHPPHPTRPLPVFLTWRSHPAHRGRASWLGWGWRSQRAGWPWPSVPRSHSGGLWPMCSPDRTTCWTGHCPPPAPRGWLVLDLVLVSTDWLNMREIFKKKKPSQRPSKTQVWAHNDKQKVKEPQRMLGGGVIFQLASSNHANRKLNNRSKSWNTADCFLIYSNISSESILQRWLYKHKHYFIYSTTDLSFIKCT